MILHLTNLNLNMGVIVLGNDNGLAFVTTASANINAIVPVWCPGLV